MQNPRNRALFIAIIAASFASALPAADLGLRFVVPPGVANRPTAGAFVLQRLDGTEHPLVKHHLSDGLVITVPAGTWELHYEDAAWWHAPQTITVPETGTEAAIQVRPTGQLALHVVAADGRVRKSIRLSLRETRAPDKTPDKTPAIDITCPVERDEALCSVPAGTFDLEATVTNALSQFLPDETVAAGKVRKLALTAFRDGSALHGWVAFARGVTRPKEPARVTLTQISEGSFQMPGVARSVAVDRKGFFRFADIPPGRYEISASAAGLASEQVIERARPSAEIALAPDLVLQAQHRIRVRVTPAADPEGDP